MNLPDKLRSDAYSLLGHTPGPGIDIIFLPELPVAYFYTIRCSTLCGAAFIQKLWNGQGRIASGRDFTKMKKELSEFGLSYHTDWSEVVETIE